MKVWHWLTQTNNPYDIYGFFPASYLDITYDRSNGSISLSPLTWYWRCAPRWIWFTIAAVGIWHFAVVVTKVK